MNEEKNAFAPYFPFTIKKETTLDDAMSFCEENFDKFFEFLVKNNRLYDITEFLRENMSEYAEHVFG